MKKYYTTKHALYSKNGKRYGTYTKYHRHGIVRRTLANRVNRYTKHW